MARTMKRLEPGPFVVPMPTVLIGADVNGKPNFMTAAFVAITNVKPPMIACGLNPSHRTCDGIIANQAFSVCVPSADMAEVVDWCGIASGHRDDKSRVFEIFRGDLVGAPMIRDCALSAECRLVQSTPYAVDTLYVAEIVSVYAKEECLTDGRVDWSKVSPLLFTFPDPSYWKLGAYVGKAWHIGRARDVKQGKAPE
jgi:flavin reductase (DIM6/NTAB) family NADH-FMN oxidoreductase RutF